MLQCCATNLSPNFENIATEETQYDANIELSEGTI